MRLTFPRAAVHLRSTLEAVRDAPGSLERHRAIDPCSRCLPHPCVRRHPTHEIALAHQCAGVPRPRDQRDARAFDSRCRVTLPNATCQSRRRRSLVACSAAHHEQVVRRCFRHGLPTADAAAGRSHGARRDERRGEADEPMGSHHEQVVRRCFRHGLPTADAAAGRSHGARRDERRGEADAGHDGVREKGVAWPSVYGRVRVDAKVRWTPKVRRHLARLNSGERSD